MTFVIELEDGRVLRRPVRDCVEAMGLLMLLRQAGVRAVRWGMER